MSKLKERRKAAGLTQCQLAAQVPGITVRTLQHYEQGSLDLNRAAAITVWYLAQALDCEMWDLLELPEDAELEMEPVPLF